MEYDFLFPCFCIAMLKFTKTVLSRWFVLALRRRRGRFHISKPSKSICHGTKDLSTSQTTTIQICLSWPSISTNSIFLFEFQRTSVTCVTENNWRDPTEYLPFVFRLCLLSVDLSRTIWTCALGLTCPRSRPILCSYYFDWFDLFALLSHSE